MKKAGIDARVLFSLSATGSACLANRLSRESSDGYAARSMKKSCGAVPKVKSRSNFLESCSSPAVMALPERVSKVKLERPVWYCGGRMLSKSGL
jgi:hypothetical protein